MQNLWFPANTYRVVDTVKVDDINGGSEVKEGWRVKNKTVAIVRMLRAWRPRERGLISGRSEIYFSSLNSTEL